METNKEPFIYDISTEELNAYVFKYFKIFGFYFILPFWLILAINGVVIVVKFFSRLNNTFVITDEKQFLSLTVLLGLLLPLYYFVWFFYRTVRQVARAFYQDFLVVWNKELASQLTALLFNTYSEGATSFSNLNFDSILLWITHKISRLPKWLQWIVKKIIDQIPFLEIVNAYDLKDLETGDKPTISANIEAKINAFQQAAIEELVPWFFVFIIPIHLVLLIAYCWWF